MHKVNYPLYFIVISGVVVMSKDLNNHKGEQHIERKYHLIREIVWRGDIVITKVALVNNRAYPFTKA